MCRPFQRSTRELSLRIFDLLRNFKFPKEMNWPIFVQILTLYSHPSDPFYSKNYILLDGNHLIQKDTVSRGESRDVE